MSTKQRRTKHFVRAGEIYGHLKVIALDEKRTTYGKRVFICECSCGKTTSVRGGALTNGMISCGCKRLEKLRTILAARATHGESRGCKQSKLYLCYENIIKRCYKPNCQMYYCYGARGIKMCQRWLNDRANFFADIGQPPETKSMIERIDNDKGYWCGKPECPECGPLNRAPNCRWATLKEQSVNRSNNVKLTFKGETKTMSQWAEQTGIDYRLLQSRHAFGWSDERILTAPVRQADRFEFNGENLTLDEWAAKTGIPRYTIAQRIKKLGWSIERSVTTPNKDLKGHRK